MGVHTTQFAIRGARALLEPVLQLGGAARSRRTRHGTAAGSLKIAGAMRQDGAGRRRGGARPRPRLRRRACSASARCATAAMPNSSRTAGAWRTCCRCSASTCSRRWAAASLGYGFWRALRSRSRRVVAIKVAPFNRYQTLDVVRALARVGPRRRGRALHRQRRRDRRRPADRLRPRAARSARPLRRRPARPVGRLDAAGRSSCSRRCGPARAGGAGRGRAAAASAQQLTDANAALFDARNGFAGCIAGIHEVLRRQGLLAGRFCLDPAEDLSPGQLAGDRPRAAPPIPRLERRRLRRRRTSTDGCAEPASPPIAVVRAQECGSRGRCTAVCSAHPFVLDAALSHAARTRSAAARRVDVEPGQPRGRLHGPDSGGVRPLAALAGE